MSSQLRRLVREQHSQTRAPQRTDAVRRVMLVRGEEEALAPYCLTHQGDLHLCNLTIGEAVELSLHKEVSRIQVSYSELSAHLDTLTQIVNINNVWQGANLPQAYTGKGVLIGFPDGGLDYTHPAFRDENDGHLRIVRAWDKLDIAAGAEYDASSNYPLGRLLSDPAEILAKRRSVDSQLITHATLTHSTAAGIPAGTPYRGVAYDADIFSTTELLSSNKNLVDQEYLKYYTDEFLLLSISNIFAYADSIGQPCVISYSLGASQDMTDVEIMKNQYLERLLTPGHIMVASAGNDGEKRHFLKKTTKEERVGARLYSTKEMSALNVSTTAPLLLRFTASGAEGVNYDIPLDMQIGDTLSASGLKWYDFSATDTLSADFDSLAVTIYSGYDGFDSTRVGYDIFVEYLDKKPTDSDIVVQFVGKGADANIFISEGEFKPVKTSSGFYFAASPVGLGTMNSPASLPAVIAVGSTSHRIQWIKYDGSKKRYSTDAPNADRAYFSSCGPSMHGFMKPDVMAPGMAVVAALNSEYYAHNQSYIDNRVTLKYAPDGVNEYQWAVDCGTSLSAPVVAGIIALWLQADPTLTVDRVKVIFAKTCRQDDSMLTLLKDDGFDWAKYNHGYQWPNYECGYGEIDAYRGLLEVLGLSGIPEISTRQLQAMSVLPDGRGNLVLSAQEALSSARRCSVYSVSGQLLSSQLLRAGEKEFTLHLSDYTGVVAVQIEGLGSTLVRL